MGLQCKLHIEFSRKIQYKWAIIGNPGIEAIFDELGIVVDCIKRIEAALGLTPPRFFPTIVRMVQKLDNIVNRKQLCCGEGKAQAHL